MSQEPTTHWENEELSFKTYDHPEANGRKAVIGEQEHTLKFPLDDKRMLTIRMGRIGFESLTDMLMKMLADAPSENDDNPAAPAIFAKLRQELASARTALASENAKLREDKERLDWLLATGNICVVRQIKGCDTTWDKPTTRERIDWHINHPDDAARKAALRPGAPEPTKGDAT